MIDRKGHRKRILMYVGNTEFIVQVWAGCPAGAPDVTNHIPLSNAASLANARREAVKVSIGRRVPIVVAQDNEVSIAPLLSEEFDMTVGRGADAGADRRGVIHPFVCPPVSMDRM